jgi:hypothetical protein
MAVLSAFQRPQVVSVESDVPLFPWGFLIGDNEFDDTRIKSFDPLQLWAFKHELQQLADGVSPFRKIAAPASIVAAISPDIDCGRHSDGDHTLGKAERNVQRTETIHDLGQSLQRFDADCLYFYGHAYHDDPPAPYTSWIRLDGAELTVKQLEQKYDAPVFMRNPVVVFLNGCCTSPMNTWNKDTVAGFLVHRGGNSVCCIVTVAQIPEGFALQFSHFFWLRFLDGGELGTALRHARREMLARGSPLGLVYELIGRADTHIDSVKE